MGVNSLAPKEWHNILNIKVLATPINHIVVKEVLFLQLFFPLCSKTCLVGVIHNYIGNNSHYVQGWPSLLMTCSSVSFNEQC